MEKKETKRINREHNTIMPGNLNSDAETNFHRCPDLLSTFFKIIITARHLKVGLMIIHCLTVIDLNWAADQGVHAEIFHVCTRLR